MLKGFRQFILKGNAVDLAVGVVIGASFGQIISSLVKGIITPFIGLVVGQRDFSSYIITIGHSKFLIGDFFGAIAAFLINATVIYFFVITPMNHLIQRVDAGKTEDPAEKTCTECLSLIPVKAKKCKFCASPQKSA